MPDIIQLLPDSIANQIAAGEVVQRPASAVKELMENSIDAGATNIKLVIKEAGKSLIQVIDNGRGMSESDARMSLERHATSKIRSADDLFKIRTMGFRGEALASIAAIAHVEMKTRLQDDELGTCLIIEGSEVKSQEPVACEQGTSICVKNLFYNIPARRNFLKSNSVEFNHIVDEFFRLALAHPEIAFMMVNGDEIEYDLPPGKLSQRIVHLFGKNYQHQLAPCQEETDLIKITGYIGKPEAAKRTRGEQFLYVNKRFIRSNYLHHAVMTAFEGLLQDGSFPFYVLFIEIDPKHIDVNVHPTKTEIKFDDERSIYGVILATIRQAVGAHNMAPPIDFNADINLISKIATTAPQDTKDIYYEERFQTNFDRSNLNNWEKMFDAPRESALMAGTHDQPTTLRFESAVNQAESTVLSEEKVIFQIHHRYIVRQVRSGMMIVDQQAAHERILFEKFLAQLNNKSGESQQTLFPQTITFGTADFTMIFEMESEINALGFRFEVFGKNTLLVTGVPPQISAGREKELFEGMIEQFKINQSTVSLPLQDNLAQALARRSAIKSGQRLSREEMLGLIDNLFTCQTPNYAPDGRPSFFIFELNKMESYFNRP